MPSLTFEGESHGEIVQKVRRWLQSVEHGEEVTKLTPAEAVERGAELTKDALQIIAVLDGLEPPPDLLDDLPV